MYPKNLSIISLHRYMVTASRPFFHATALPMPSMRGDAVLMRTSSSVVTVRVPKFCCLQISSTAGGKSLGTALATSLKPTPALHCWLGSVLHGCSRKRGKSRSRYMPALTLRSADEVTYTHERNDRFTHAVSSMSSSPRSSALTTKLLILNLSFTPVS